MSARLCFTNPAGAPVFITPADVSSVSADTDHGPGHTRLIVGGTLQVVRGEPRDVEARLEAGK